MRLDGLKMISVIENMSRWQKQQGNTPAVVHCGGGVGRGAAFIAIANCLEQVHILFYISLTTAGFSPQFTFNPAVDCRSFCIKISLFTDLTGSA